EQCPATPGAKEVPTLPATPAATPPPAPGQTLPPPACAAPRSAAGADPPGDRRPLAGLHRRLDPPDRRALRRPAPGRDPDYRLPHRPEPVAHGRCARPRASFPLPSRLLAPPLRAVAVGACPGRLCLAALAADRAGGRGRRRHRRRAQGPEGLRQGLPSRPGALDPVLHRVPLGAQVGGP